ncbi:hypothetical protein J2S40_004274 [Nocardioides luteus]|uniref:NfeD-like C-terminal domain-containing protein n=1 Tax=Nocardioides luteus TaxID=1844 RepID=A0ABQ5SR85_9ACTN|nr:NfeD family protein [Nocardioides luteus]MDR7313216.1 hypothetical protein [Nocardioides luteus]GGR43233.1 hypothetical protein GCM10010197_05810 [Nocardioides luteus]GLJ66281.1 hypothetical protein GCM10017579_03170 [Nocardioides luteus]
MTTFLLIGAVGLGLLLVSLVIGDLLDGFLGGLTDWLESDWFSTAAIGGFVSAFGFGGAIAHGPLSLGLLPSVVIGSGFGAIFAWFALWLTRLLKDDHTDAAPSGDDAIGMDAAVITEIPAGGFGVVRVVLGGHTVTYNAKAPDAGEAITPGTAVHVTGVLSPTAVTVAPTWREITS